MHEYHALKQEIVAMGVRLLRSGLAFGTAGNVSARLPDMEYFYVTPSGMAYESIQAQDIVGVDYAGNVVEGTRRPSIEHMMHADILRNRPDVGAVVHTHSPWATAVAAARQPIPAFLETIIAANGDQVGVAEFAPAGSRELAENVVRALGAASAVLLASHGVVGVGRDLAQAFGVCESVEKAAMVFLLSHILGGPVRLPERVVAEQSGFFRTGYGQRTPPA